MAFSEYGKYDAVGLADFVRKKEVSAGELLDEAIARTAKVDPQINAVVVKHYDYAKKQVDKGLPDGPFSGVPFLLKDLDLLKARSPPLAPACTATMSAITAAPSPGASSTRAWRFSARAQALNSG